MHHVWELLDEPYGKSKNNMMGTSYETHFTHYLLFMLISWFKNFNQTQVLKSWLESTFLSLQSVGQSWSIPRPPPQSGWSGSVLQVAQWNLYVGMKPSITQVDRRHCFSFKNAWQRKTFLWSHTLLASSLHPPDILLSFFFFFSKPTLKITFQLSMGMGTPYR